MSDNQRYFENYIKYLTRLDYCDFKVFYNSASVYNGRIRPEFQQNVGGSRNINRHFYEFSDHLGSRYYTVIGIDGNNNITRPQIMIYQ